MARKTRPVMGWREWISLPALGVAAIKVKVDTGARTSSLHAYDIRPVRRRGVLHVRFVLHPIQRNARITVEASAKVLDQRTVRSSAGHEQTRYVIESPMRFLDETWPIEITLTSRDAMGFRMLLGRQAIRGRYAVDPGRSYLGGRPPRSKRRPRS
jgi:hypothetical protein